jgi:hypothetical protein
MPRRILPYAALFTVSTAAVTVATATDAVVKGNPREMVATLVAAPLAVAGAGVTQRAWRAFSEQRRKRLEVNASLG